MAIKVDVAIIGGGPAASTLGTLLRKYDSHMRVAIFEREVFPRDHVGESQIPHLMSTLHEMGVWDKVEAANFPIKIGGMYKWGTTQDLWALDFLPVSQFKDEPRPGKYRGQRAGTAFQVDRSIYDKILLEHAEEAGCMVYQGVKVTSVEHDGDRITGLTVAATDPMGEAVLRDQDQVRAKWYIDASGNSGLLRRTMGVGVDSPTALRNVAIYDYWQNTEWAERIGVGGTRILTLSIECGWLWFIPLGPTRTSIGLVVPADYLKKTGKRPDELYFEAVNSEPTVSKLIAKATCERITQTTKDWSFVASRLYGENWFLAGDTAGFADPILSAGLTLAQTGSRNLACTILEIERGQVESEWLKKAYEQTQTARIKNHIRFADYWYSTNGHFTELKEYCMEIAKSAGVTLSPQDAFTWMGSGGFANDEIGTPAAATFTIAAVKYNIRSMTGVSPKWEVEKYNRFHLNLEGATQHIVAAYHAGAVYKVNCFRRDHYTLADRNVYGAMLAALRAEKDVDRLLTRYVAEARRRGLSVDYETIVRSGVDALEAMLVEGWITGEAKPGGRYLGLVSAYPEQHYHLGWVEEGVGLTSLNPSYADRVVLQWDEMQNQLTA